MAEQLICNSGFRHNPDFPITFTIKKNGKYNKKCDECRKKQNEYGRESRKKNKAGVVVKRKRAREKKKRENPEGLMEMDRMNNAKRNKQEQTEPKSKLRAIKNSAKKREIPFAKEDWDVMENRLEDPCDLCGAKDGVFLNGLDRIDSSKGYMAENTVACCQMCNVTKGKLSKDELLFIGVKIVKHLDLKVDHNIVVNRLHRLFKSTNC